MPENSISNLSWGCGGTWPVVTDGELFAGPWKSIFSDLKAKVGTSCDSPKGVRAHVGSTKWAET